ncbi:MAG: hypothetical protein AAFX87_20360 [Bacteroidota bacterium]
MKKLYTILSLLLATTLAFAGTDKPTSLKANFVLGSPEIQSINAITFGPEGVLFIGDSKSGKIFAIDTQDEEKVESVEAVAVKKVDEQLAALMGTTADNIAIQDMAVNPLSKKVYLAVHKTDGTPALLTLENEAWKPVDLSNIKYSEQSLENLLADDAKDRRGRSLRVWTVSDLGYHNGQVMVTGLSNQEFSSTFRSLAFPFKKEQAQTSLEIYHVAHGRYETYAPIKTFTTAELGGKQHIVASYTCTPLVVFPMDQLKSGQHVKGRTIAELGNRNSPLDIITIEKEGKKYLLMANSSRAVMKIGYDKLEAFSQSLTNPLSERGGTEGVDFIALPFVNVLQMDKLDNNQVLMLQRRANGDLDLWTAGSRWF